MRDYKKDVTSLSEVSSLTGDARGSNFSTDEIRTLLDLLTSHEVTEFKLERGGEKLWLKRGQSIALIPTPTSANPLNVAAPVQFPTVPSSAPASGPIAPIFGPPTTTPSLSPSRAENLVEVRSPIVGTFYRKPAVDAAPYVAVGDVVKKGDVLCIVEAMKLMNEIESEVAGRVVQICLQDGQMVEYGEVLFRIEPSS